MTCAQKNFSLGTLATNIVTIFRSNVMPWQDAVDKAGSRLVVVKHTKDGWTDAVIAAAEGAGVVAVPSVHW